jgi:hypothetical protein
MNAETLARELRLVFYNREDWKPWESLSQDLRKDWLRVAKYVIRKMQNPCTIADIKAAVAILSKHITD